MDDRDWAIWSLENAVSVAEAGSAGTEVRAAFSAATMESGRLLVLSIDWEFGRLCHEGGEGRPPADEMEEGDVTLVRLGSKSKGEWFSLDGEVDRLVPGLPIPSEISSRRARGLSSIGDEVRFNRSGA